MVSVRRLLFFLHRYALGKEAAEALLVDAKGILALAGDATDCMRETAETVLAHLKVACLLQRLDLHTQVATCTVSNLTEIHEAGTLQAVERHHDLQAELVMEQGVDDRKPECAH